MGSIDILIPKSFGGRDGQQALEDLRTEAEKRRLAELNKPKSHPTGKPFNDYDPAHFVILPAHNDPVDKKDSYPELWVSTYSNIYVGTEWKNRNVVLSKDGPFFLLNLRQYMDFLYHLTFGKLKMANGRPLPEIDRIRMTEGIFNFGSEYLDNSFLREGEEIFVQDCYFDMNNCRLPRTQKLERYLEEKTDLDSVEWISKYNKQGVPNEKNKTGKIKYTPPVYDKLIKSSVARWECSVDSGMHLNLSASHDEQSCIIGLRPAMVKP